MAETQVRQEEGITDRKKKAVAERNGYSFFEAALKRNSTQAVKIWGVVDLQIIPLSATRQGATPDFHIIQKGGQAKFFYDEDRFGFYATILDDKEGHNRNFFASCWDDGDYDILDAEVKADVLERASKLRDKAKQQLAEDAKDIEQKAQKNPKLPKKETVSPNMAKQKTFPCPHCKKDVREDTKWCPNCSVAVEPEK